MINGVKASNIYTIAGTGKVEIKGNALLFLFCYNKKRVRFSEESRTREMIESLGDSQQLKRTVLGI